MTTPLLTPTLLHRDADKPTLILGPSLGTGSLALWGPAAPALSEHFQLLAWDLPGHGASSPSTADFSVAELAAAVVAMLEALEADGIVVPGRPLFYAGVSIGGATGLQLGHDYPSLFAGISIVCSSARFATPEFWNDRAELVAVAGTPTMVTGSAERWFAPGFIEKNPVPATDLLHNLQDADRFSYAHACRALGAYDLSGRLGAVSAPVLAIAGAHDVVSPPEHARAIAAGVADGRAAVIDTVAHLAPAEDPAATSALLIDFFTSIPTKEATHG